MKKLTVIAAIVIALCGCSAGNVEEIKQNAAQVWASNGFEVVGYQGYQWATMDQWGGRVWYTVKRGNVTYEGNISKWGKEFHIYNLRALDAVKGN